MVETQSILSGAIVTSLFIGCLVLWIKWARTTQDKVKRFEKMAGIFLVWFILNGILMILLLQAPVWYEPAPIVPGLIALYSNLPMLVILSIPFIVDMIYQQRKG